LQFSNVCLQLQPGADPASKFRGAISVVFGSQVSLRIHCCKTDEIYFTTQQWTAKWP